MQSYTESVPQDLSIGREVMRVSATDIDDGNNSVVRYSIKPKRLEDEIYFRIDRNTGVIFLNHTIDVSIMFSCVLLERKKKKKIHLKVL